MLLRYYEGKIQHICKDLKLLRKVLGTALVFFKRFYLSYAAAEHDPQGIVLTCLYLACKTTDCYISAAELARLSGTQPDLVLKNEMLLLQGLQYDLIVHLPYIAIDSFIQALLNHVGSSDASAPDSGRLARIKAAAYEASDALMLTDAPLLYTPGQLALAATLAAGSKVGCCRCQIYRWSCVSM